MAVILNRFCGFQSTLPMKGVTNRLDVPGKVDLVSIHTPNEGSDQGGKSPDTIPFCFNPHSQ